MRSVVLLVVVLSFSLPVLARGQERRSQTIPCEVPEASGFNRVYDELVCRGIANFQLGRYSSAAEDFVAALAVPVEDSPNVELYARLAHAQWLAGAKVDARASLARAELALPVLAGIYVCTSHDGTGGLRDRLGRAIPARGLDDLVREMCAEGYQGAYGNWSLENVKRLASLINILEEATRAIRDSAPTP